MISFEPLPKQHQAWQYLQDETTNEILFGGAAGGGKSYLLCNWVLISALTYPDTRYAICRARYTTLSKTTLLTFISLINRYELNNLVKYNGTQHIFEFTNGSKVFLIDLYQNPSDPEFNCLRGYELTGIAFDEGAEITIQAFNVLFGTRVRYNLKKYNLIPKILICSNPTKNWLYNRYYIPFRDGVLPQNIKYIQSLSTDNKYLPESYIEQLRTGPELEKQIYFYGNWEYDSNLLNIFTSKAVYNSFYSYLKHKEGDMYLTCDVAMSGNDRTCITIWNGLNCIDIQIYNNLDTLQIVKIIKDNITRYKVKISNCIIDKVGVGQGVTDLLKGCKGYIAGNTALDEEGYFNQRSQFYHKLAEYMERGNIYIKCTDDLKDQISQELEAHQKIDVDTDGKAKILSKDRIKALLGKSPDIADALSMRMFFEYSKQKMNFFVV